MAPKKVKSKEKKQREPSIILIPLTEKEQYLQKEYGVLTEHINNYTQRVEHFQEGNESLDKEAEEIQLNTKAYHAYMNRRNLRCQNAIITLNDQNLSDLEQVQKEKEELFSQYLDKEKDVKCQLKEMEIKYDQMNKEIEELQPFKELQSAHLARIWELEKELLRVKIQHTEHLQKVKTRFLQQKNEYELESQAKVEALAKRAEKEAVRSLIQHAKQVKAENWQLRTELLNLIQRAKQLRTHMNHLLEQREQLLRELQYGQDLSCMRPWLTQRPASSGSTLKDRLSAKDRTHSYHVITVLPPIEKVRMSQTSIPPSAKSSSQAKLAKSYSGLPLVPSWENSLHQHSETSCSDTSYSNTKLV